MSQFSGLIEQLNTLSTDELGQLASELAKDLGVTVPSSSNLMPAMVPGLAPAVVEKTEFNVTLTNFGTKKVEVIKLMREFTGLGLKEAKDLVEAAPKTFKEGVSKADAEAMKQKLEAAGAQVTVE